MLSMSLKFIQVIACINIPFLFFLLSNNPQYGYNNKLTIHQLLYIWVASSLGLLQKNAVNICI